MKKDRAQEATGSGANWLRRAASRGLRSLPELAAWRLESEARKLGPARIPQIFARDLKSLHPSFNEELLDIAGHAEMALRNRFVLLNQPQTFGQAIDWESSSSRAWRAELHSFEYALDLGILFRVSGEERYARHLRYLVAQWIASNPPLEGTGWEPGPLARRIRNWTLAFDLARAGWQADAEFVRVTGHSLALQSAYLKKESGAGGTLAEAPEIAVALLLASKLFSPMQAVRHSALHLLRAAVEQDLSAADSQQACPRDRVRLARAILEFILFDAGCQPEVARWLKENLERALRSVEEILLSDSSLPLFGAKAPPQSEILDDLFAAAAAVLDAGWAKGVSGNFGVTPMLLLGQAAHERFETLPEIKWAPAHTAASPSCLYRVAGAQSCLAVTAATASVAAGHQDFLSYELMMRGMRVIVDSGAGAPAGEDGDNYFKSPAAHNILLMDGKPVGPASSDSTASPAADLFTAPEFTRLRIASGGPGQAGHERFWFSFADGSWIVLDRLDIRASCRMLSLIHFFPTFEIRLREGAALAASHSLALRVTPIGGSPARIFTGCGDDANFPSRYSPDYGIQYASSVLAFEWDSAERSRWTGGYVLVPAPESEEDKIQTEVRHDEVILDTGGRILRLPLGGI